MRCYSIFGHIHQGYGTDSDMFIVDGEERVVNYINASHVNEYYEPVNKPVRIVL